MKLELNVEKSPFCTIGPFSWTFAQTEHDVDVDELPAEYRKQLLYNINRGVLKTKDREGLKALAGAMQPSTPVPLEQIPIKYQDVAQKASALVKDPIKEDLKPLRALLRQNVTTVKKEAAGYSAGRIRKLLELEKEGKKRKSVISFLAESLEKHELAVMNAVGTEEDTIFNQADPFAKSTQVSDIVESESETVVFSPDDVETSEEGGLLLTQQVLNQLDEV